MPSNDDMKYQSDETTKGRAPADAPVASVLPNDQAAGADETSANEPFINKASADESSALPLSTDLTMPDEFTFFQKKKREVREVVVPYVAYVSAAQVTAFAERLDSAAAVNSKTQRHIAELMTLMSDVARTMTADISKPTRKRLRRSKWLFYVCLVGFGVGWFLLFPSGRNFLTQLATLLAR